MRIFNLFLLLGIISLWGCKSANTDTLIIDLD
jgi:hypothetical protein